MTCTKCGGTTADGIYLDERCQDTLWSLLSQIPDTLTDAEDTVARLDRKAATRASNSSAASSGLNVEVMSDVLDLQGLIGSWAQMLLEDVQEGAGEQPLHYLRARMDAIITRDWAGEMLDELTAAHRKVSSAVDVRRETIILRTCGTLLEDGTHCEGQVKLGYREEEWARCRVCGSWFSVEAVRREQAQRIKGEPMRAADVRRYLSQTARVQVEKKDMENWIQLGRLTYVLERVETGKRPRRAYFPGDVLRLHLEMRDRRRPASLR